ncbi:MAG: hypothetical protein PVJ46_11530 [Methyloceanibacter sp.]
MNRFDAKFSKRSRAWSGVFAGFIFLLALMITTPSVHAQVVSASARYDLGTLWVYGATAKPRQYVQLNRFRIKQSNQQGGFLFKQTRLPRSCFVRLRSAGKVRKVPIRNCPLRN